MKIGIFGGSFDPIHLGHLWIAESAIETLGLDQVRWIPAAKSPLKPHGPVASDQDRLEMVRLAISGAEKHRLDDREIRRGEISYSVDTVADLQAEFPTDEFCLIIGSDSLALIHKWYQAKKLLERILPAVVQRGGEPDIDFSVLNGLVDPKRVKMIRDHVIKMPVIEISSSEIRERVAQGRSIRYRVPRSVEALLEARKIYHDSSR
ncbi:Nicotinate-nucleotide adenylyltransferase [Planctomycetes bacterium CA13]|uniref:Probable nicotinate-nucleotide adenylyltransferase n=1 Tax=Novipirellula herctigrandis TaxID=2527986 RepID=A0A5C5Z6W5_9BACT|nr:Nicotinate-nucleotide adenylyltransferase [Planctomycetes bacterium CA13]